MNNLYHLTVTAIGLTSQQVRAVMARLGWEEVLCDDFIDRGRQCTRWHGMRTFCGDTAEAHAALVDQFQEYADLLALQTCWREEGKECPDCLQPVNRCICDLLADDGMDESDDDDG